MGLNFRTSKIVSSSSYNICNIINEEMTIKSFNAKGITTHKATFIHNFFVRKANNFIGITNKVKECVEISIQLQMIIQHQLDQKKKRKKKKKHAFDNRKKHWTGWVQYIGSGINQISSS